MYSFSSHNYMSMYRKGQLQEYNAALFLLFMMM